MTYIKVEDFSGIVPRTGPTRLDANQAQLARNVKLQSRELRSWSLPLLEYTPSTPDTQTIYHIDSPNGDKYWLEWGTDVDMVPGPVADVSEFRYYYTGDGAPKKTNWALATTSGTGLKPYPNAYLSMGVPAPTTAPTLAAAGGSGTLETRAYVYTYVSTFGTVLEESGPSAPTVVSCYPTGATVTVSGFTRAATYTRTTTLVTITEASHGLTTGMVVKLNFTSGTAIDGWYTVTVVNSSTYTVTTAASGSTSGNVTVEVKAPAGTYNITARRIYRTIAGASATVYSFVAEIPIATTTYADTLTVAQLGAEIPSLIFEPPPNDLKGLVAMPNGVLAGFIGNQIYFSEPYFPHAWPSQYMLTVDYPIVGLGVYQNNLAVLTTRYPYVISGVSPLSMTQIKLPLPQPCISKKSIASDQYGVLYASPNGLVSLGAGTQDVVTTPLYTRDEWQNLNPYTMVGAVYNNLYMGFYQSGEDTRAIVLSRGDIPPLVDFDFPARALFIDRSTSDIYAVSKLDNNVYHLDASQINFTIFEWLSKKFVLPNPQNFAAVKVQADYDFMNNLAAYIAYVNAIKAYNTALFISTGGQVGGTLNSGTWGLSTGVLNEFAVNGSLLKDIPEAGTVRYITLIIYADGEQIFTTDVLTEEPIRMPALQKGYVYEIRISGNTPVRMVAMATSIGELRQIGN